MFIQKSTSKRGYRTSRTTTTSTPTSSSTTPPPPATPPPIAGGGVPSLTDESCTTRAGGLKRKHEQEPCENEELLKSARAWAQSAIRQRAEEQNDLLHQRALYKRNYQEEQYNSKRTRERMEAENITTTTTGTPAELLSITSTTSPAAVSEAINAASNFWNVHALMKYTCACCDVSFPSTQIERVTIDQHVVDRLSARLQWMPTIPPEVRNQYKSPLISNSIWATSDLVRIALSPRGIISSATSDNGHQVVQPPSDLILLICKMCHQSLFRSDKKDSPPKFSIANGWATGSLPTELRDLSYAEIRMATRAPVASVVRVIGRNRTELKSHTMALLATPGPATLQVPFSLQKTDYMVIFSGAHDHDKDDAKRKYLLVRHLKLKQFIDHLLRHSSAYKNVSRDEALLKSIVEASVLDNLTEEDDDTTSNGRLIREASEDADRVNAGGITSLSQNESVSALFSTSPNTTTYYDGRHAPSTSIMRTPLSTTTGPLLPHLQVTNSSTILSERDPEFFGAAFPHLFPFGIGTPSSRRPVHVPIEEGMRHLLRLSNRSFAQDFLFPFVCFDILNRKKAFCSLSVRIKSNPSALSDAVNISESQMTSLMNYNAAAVKARRSGKRVPLLPDELQSANNVLKSIESAASHAFGTKEERQMMKHTVDAYCHEFGRPHLMLTLSPSSHNQFHLAIRAGLQTVTSIEEALAGNELPPISTIREFASKDPVVAAEYFDEISHFFFEHILGWDLTKCCPGPRRGLFGTPLAFAGGIETQGCGLLHWHILLWISEMPSTLEAELACKGYEEILKSYIDSLITTSIPIITLFQTISILNGKSDETVEEGKVVAGGLAGAQEGTPRLPLSEESNLLSATTWCPNCGPKEFLVPNSIPTIQMTNHASFAPIIASCTRCKCRFSHISLRKAFMNLASSLCGYDTKAAQQDAICALAAPTALLPPAIFTDEEHLQLADEVQRFFLTQDGHHSIPSSSAAGGAAGTSAQHDHQETYRTRLPGEVAMHVRQIMVYTCAIVQTQEHKFAHHGSCFKKGLQTGCKHLYCRYAFPKASQCITIVRSGATEIASDEVSLRRPLGSEYLNGYLIPVLALTKANADCTVLRNKNVSYCTKYTTKAQDTVDSCALVNKYIASMKKSFENRQKIEAANPSLTDDLVARGRLFSLTWQYTNMQEIANTMASLYILRNAPPMYQSHECVPLILSSGLSMIDGKTEVVPVTRTSCGAGYKGFSPYLNYLLRPQSQEFDNVSWFSYLKNFEVVRRRRPPHNPAEAIAGDEAAVQQHNLQTHNADAPFLLSPSHPQYGSKAVTARASPVVVRIVGPGLRPSVRRDSNEKENDFSKQVLLLFLPHRTVGELKRNKMSWIESLNDAYANKQICDAGLRFLRNHEDRWECILRSQDLAASFKESLLEIDAKISLEEDSNCRGVCTKALAQSDDASNGGYLSSEDDEDEIADELREISSDDVALVEEDQTLSSNEDLLLVDEFHMPEEFITNKLKNPEMTKKLMASTIPTLFTAYKTTPKTEVPYFAHCNTLEEGLKPQVMLGDEDSDGEEEWSRCDAADNMVQQQENQEAPRLMEVREVQSFQLLVEYAVVWPQTQHSKALFETKRGAWVKSRMIASAHAPADVKKSTCFVTIEIDQPQKEIPLFASIAEISNVCSLLEDQHRAFFIIGSALLRSFARDEMDVICGEKDAYPSPCSCSASDPSSELEEQQALLLIHGVGGSGKSVIVRAITALATSWMRDRAIITASIAGVACVNISGYTIASLMYKKRSFFDQVKLIIIDEVSMTGQRSLHNFSKHLEKLRAVNIPFGGISLVLCGDFFQLPPVKDHPLYAKPRAGASGESPGHVLYNLITQRNVVIFDQVLRTPNKEYADYQQQVRIGAWDESLVSAINERCPEEDGRGGRVHQPVVLEESFLHRRSSGEREEYVPTMVTTNESRQLLYDIQMQAFTKELSARNLELPILLLADFDVVQSKKGARCSRTTEQKQPPLTPQELSFLRNKSSEHEFDRFPPAIMIYVGAQVLFTHNKVGITYGIANGTRGKIIGWQFAPETYFQKVTYRGSHVLLPCRRGPHTKSSAGGTSAAAPTSSDARLSQEGECIPSRIEFVLVEVLSSKMPRQPPNQPPGLPPNVVAVPSITHTISNAFKLPPPTTPAKTSAFSTNRRRLTKLKITQVPLRQASVLTSYCVQGNQYDKFIIAESCPKQFYIPFSRGKQGMESITMGFKLSKSFWAKAVPSKELVEEIKRLRELHLATKARLGF